jgi:hypothetical protein
MMVITIGIEYALDMTVQRLHDADPGQHRRAAFRRDQDQGMSRNGTCSRVARSTEAGLDRLQLHKKEL